MDTKVCIIGAGPAGLMAAISAAQAGAGTSVVESNTNPGRKLLITGGGRCNFTHAGTLDTFIRDFGTSGRFLRYCFHEFSPDDVRQFFAERGIQSKVEADGSVFPVSDRAEDVREVLVAEAKRLDVRFHYGRCVRKIQKNGAGFEVHCDREIIAAEKVIIATGGMSWPKTGSTGDGYRFAGAFGHTIIEPRASLVPLLTSQDWPAQLAGVAMDNVTISAKIDNKKVSVSGSFLFTHDGIGGPVAIDLSRIVIDTLHKAKKPVEVFIDMVAAVERTEFEKTFVEQINTHPKKMTCNILAEYVPRRLAAALCRMSGIAQDSFAAELRKESRKKIVQTMKTLPLTVTGTRPLSEAIVTRGGVCLDQIDSKTMESKLCPGLYFAGEVMDVDGPCGGYNLQICWSTGALAGKNAGR